jgi:hypothetical protein
MSYDVRRTLIRRRKSEVRSSEVDCQSLCRLIVLAAPPTLALQHQSVTIYHQSDVGAVQRTESSLVPIPKKNDTNERCDCKLSSSRLWVNPNHCSDHPRTHQSPLNSSLSLLLATYHLAVPSLGSGRLISPTLVASVPSREERLEGRGTNLHLLRKSSLLPDRSRLRETRKSTLRV